MRIRRKILSLAKFSSDFLMESFTLVDNLFINEHLPHCTEKQIKVYLYGLYMCSMPEKMNSLDEMCATLGVSEAELVSVYTDFEDAGLVRVISKSPLEVAYCSLKRAMQPPKKYKSEKWNDFNRELQELFHERMLTPNEYNEYYTFLDSVKMDRDAMLMIVRYCIELKGESVRYPYILTVARNWANEGVRTVAEARGETDAHQMDEELGLHPTRRPRSGKEHQGGQDLPQAGRAAGRVLPHGRLHRGRDE